MINKPWFKAKKYGYGWGLPLTWQGWLAMGIYIASLGAFLYGIVLGISEHVSTLLLIMLLLQHIAIAAMLVLLTWATGEQAGWRWGKKDGDYSK